MKSLILWLARETQRSEKVCTLAASAPEAQGGRSRNRCIRSFLAREVVASGGLFAPVAYDA
ncbi:hypothetical protein AAGS40_27290 (plasmid) [Paraburkholderia sp. PREW-6R]|uniref:hypothetical protein n=1 Tax=Paraburkholderia sp. PREW-6R TaxID=3141544 RepID=UPI0031F5C367